MRRSLEAKMTQWVPKAQETLLIPSGNANGNHLFVILNDPIQIDGYPKDMCCMVGVTTQYPNVHYDPACLLPPGCHPFIQHDSYAAYRYARLEPAAHLIGRVAEGVFVVHQPMQDPAFSYIKSGLFVSRFTVRAYKGLAL
jgi:hypothetical protein